MPLEIYWQVGIGRQRKRGSSVRVLGVDPGIATCGYGIVRQDRGRATLMEAGAIQPPGRGAARLVVLHDAICRLIETFELDAAAVELLYHNRNVKTAADVGQARGVILLALERAGLEIAEYTPTQMKLAITGDGRADKRQVQRLVAMRLGLEKPPTPDDAADAVGLCLCYLHSAGLRQTVAAAQAGRRAP